MPPFRASTPKSISWISRAAATPTVGLANAGDGFRSGFVGQIGRHLSASLGSAGSRRTCVSVDSGPPAGRRGSTSPVQGDPVAPYWTMLAVADAFEGAAVAFDRAGRGDVVRQAGDEDAVQAQG